MDKQASSRVVSCEFQQPVPRLSARVLLLGAPPREEAYSGLAAPHPQNDAPGPYTTRTLDHECSASSYIRDGRAGPSRLIGPHASFLVASARE